MRAFGWIGAVLGLGGVLGVGVARLDRATAVATAGPVAQRIVARAEVVPADGVAEVRARIDGRVLRVAVREGERVEAGQLLAEIESTAVRAEVARREAERGALEAGAVAVEEGARPEERAEVAAEVAALAHEAAEARDRARRVRQLRRGGSATDADGAEAEHALGAVLGRLAAARARLRLARHGGRPADVRAARARLAAASASVTLAQDELSRATVLAPIAGVVLARRADPGDTVSGSAVGATPPMFELADPARTEVRVEVEETDALGLTVGLPATLTTPGGARVVGRGRIARVGARLARRTIGATDARLRADGWVREAWIAVDGAAAVALPIGQRLEAQIDGGALMAPVRVPRSAVSVRDGRAVVDVAAVVGSHAVPVELGSADEQFVEVRGLRAGERVVLHP